MAKTVRSAISIPLDLKADMEAFEAGGHEVNWSALACLAFRAEMNRIKHRGRTPSLAESLPPEVADLLYKLSETANSLAHVLASSADA